MTKFAVIAAVDEKGGFSKNGEIPWYFSEDFKRFRKITEGHICVMGRKTYEDINARLGEKAVKEVLPNRTSFVLSSQWLSRPKIQNAVAASSLEDILYLTDCDPRTVFFIGGKSIFDMGLILADEIYLTIVSGDYECDLFLPLDEILKTYHISMEDKYDSLTFLKLVRDNNK